MFSRTIEEIIWYIMLYALFTYLCIKHLSLYVSISSNNYVYFARKVLQVSIKGKIVYKIYKSVYKIYNSLTLSLYFRIIRIYSYYHNIYNASFIEFILIININILNMQ